MFSRIRKIFTEYKELKYLAYHDSLTGLLNRNWLYRNIDKIKHRYVYFIDINNLHEINKNGHFKGDYHIKKIVSDIKYIIDHNDIFVRYGGDEFIIFSDRPDALLTNKTYSVGCFNIYMNIDAAIYAANAAMLYNKKITKNGRT